MHHRHDEEPWTFTIVRLHGLSYMRPEKSWRPIVTFEIDSHQHHEVAMGCDGQNPNLKSAFSVHGAHPGSRVEVKVWHRGQSKKKGKKRNLVATCAHPLGDLLKKQDLDSKLELRLNCQQTSRKNSASKGKPQNGAHVHLRLVAPSSARAGPSRLEPLDLTDVRSEDGSCHPLSDAMTPPLSPASESSECGSDAFPDKPPSANVIRPFCVDSDDDDSTLDGALDEKQPLLSSYEDDRDPYYSDPRAIQPLPEGLLIPSVLPQYTEVVAMPEDRLSRIELLLSAFTMYSELKEARLDSHFEKVFGRLQTEWTYIGGLLVALAAVDTAVFAISDDSIFDVDPYARNAIAASSIASGLGISCDAWFLLRYNWADLHTFIHRAKDVFDSYFFFAISARVPCFCMLISAISLLGFLGRVAYNVWPEGVIIACFVVGMLMTLQFLAKGAVVFVNTVRGVNRHVVRGVGWVARRGSSGTVSGDPAIRK